MELERERADARIKSERNLANRFGSGASSQRSNTPEPEQSEENIEHKDFKNQKIPAFIRNTAAALVASGGSSKAVGAALGMTQSAAHRLGSGSRTSDVKVKDIKEEARDLALNRLMMSLNLIDDEKLGKANLKDLSNTAAQMSRVIEKTMPKQEVGAGVSLIVYAPEIKTENEYKIVNI